MPSSRTTSTNWRAAPAGEISAAIQTLLSMTSRSTFIRKQLVQYVLVHALGSGMLTSALQRLAQTFACHALAALVALGRNHHYRGTSVAGDTDGLPLSGLQHLSEPVFGFQGCDAFHNGRSSRSGRNRQEESVAA